MPKVVKESSNLTTMGKKPVGSRNESNDIRLQHPMTFKEAQTKVQQSLMRQARVSKSKKTKDGKPRPQRAPVWAPFRRREPTYYETPEMTEDQLTLVPQRQPLSIEFQLELESIRGGAKAMFQVHRDQIDERAEKAEKAKKAAQLRYNNTDDLFEGDDGKENEHPIPSPKKVLKQEPSSSPCKNSVSRRT